MITTQTTTGLDEQRIARDAEQFARILAAADVHRGDQERAERARRRERQARFDECGLPRGLAPLS